MSLRIEAVTVNHGTSLFVELMLRSLFQHNDVGPLGAHITVLDNGSRDAHFPSLQTYAAAHDISIVQTGFDDERMIEKHGEALARHVLAHADCTHYLFLDSDIWFTEDDTISTMLSELEEAEDRFAVQARIFGFYAKRVIEGRDGRVEGSDSYEATGEWHGGPGQPDRIYPTTVATRCSPVCSLVRNHPTFRRAVAEVGLSPAMIWKPDGAVYYDTFGLVTHVMAACGLHHAISGCTVSHFTETANRPEYRGAKDRDAQRMLDELRRLQGDG